MVRWNRPKNESRMSYENIYFSIKHIMAQADIQPFKPVFNDDREAVILDVRISNDDLTSSCDLNWQVLDNEGNHLTG